MVGEIAVDAAFIDALLEKVLEKFAPDTPVTMTFRKAHFASGHDLKDFCREARTSNCSQGTSSNEREARDSRLRRARQASARTSSASRSRPHANEPVVIVEDYGYRGQEAGIPRDEERVVLDRRVWSAIADIARREFNDRLKAAKVMTGRWHTGTNLVERLLGQGALRAGLGRRDGERRADSRDLQQVGGAPSRGALVALRDDRGRGGSAGGHAARLAASAVSSAVRRREACARRSKRRRPVEPDLFNLPLFKEAE